MIPFQYEHLDLFTWREDDLKTYGTQSQLNNALASAADKGQCWTAVYDGRIMVIGGIFKHTPKTGYCFTLFSEYSVRHKIIAAKAVRQMFNGLLQDMGLHRVETYNRIGAESHNKWCEWLGFEKEGVAKKFDDEGNDYVRYALIR